MTEGRGVVLRPNGLKSTNKTFHFICLTICDRFTHNWSRHVACHVSLRPSLYAVCVTISNFDVEFWPLYVGIPLVNRCYALSVSSVYMVLHSGIYFASRYPVIGSTLAAFWWRLCNCIVGMRTTQDILKGISSELFPHDPRRTCSNIPIILFSMDYSLASLVVLLHMLWALASERG